jgi:hypothetical protein
VALHVLVTVGWFFLVAVLTVRTPGFRGPGLASASPFIGVSFATIEIQRTRMEDSWELIGWLVFWFVVELAAAGILLMAALATFDRCLGRITAGSPGRESHPHRGTMVKSRQ